MRRHAHSGRLWSAAAIVLRTHFAFVLLALALASSPGAATAGDLADTVRRIKPAIVAVGTYQAIRRPPVRLRGTGFVVADGSYVLTNAHVLPDPAADDGAAELAVFVGTGPSPEVRRARLVAEDRRHDVAVLKIPGRPLPALELGRDETVAEGTAIAFTGFPIGTVLGLYPVTHQGIVSAITPIAVPQVSPRRLNAEMIRRLRAPFSVFQLDATAYPGNSGSPLYDRETGVVIGIVSSVFVKRSKENLLKDPSGITYAIPIRFARALLRRVGALGAE